MNVAVRLNPHAATCVTVQGGLGKVQGKQIHFLLFEKVTGL